MNDTAENRTTNEVAALFAARGSAWYGGESVSQLQHALQAAWLAEQQAASSELIVAALLHDIGHLLFGGPDDSAAAGVDDRHETVAMKWLEQRQLPAAVVQPVRLHVAAKRYLCAVDEDYLNQLSPASRHSLQLQGGPMSSDEVKQFESHPYGADAVRLRKWDDEAKVVDLPTPPLNHFTDHLDRVLAAHLS